MTPGTVTAMTPGMVMAMEPATMTELVTELAVETLQAHQAVAAVEVETTHLGFLQETHHRGTR